MEQLATPRVRQKQSRSSHKTLPRRVQRVIQYTRARLRAILPNGELQSLVLYGSYVYGKPRPDSDVDLMLVYDDVTAEQEKALQDLVIELYDVHPRPHLFLFRAEKMRRDLGVSPLLYNVAHRGITLEGVPVPEHEINREQVSKQLLDKAQASMKLAQLALDNDLYDGCISNSFYAVLHASDAALATRGLVAKSHTGTEASFGIQFFKTRIVDEKFKGLFHRIHEARIKADYDHEVIFTHDEAVYWFERAREFVAAMEAQIPQWLADSEKS